MTELHKINVKLSEGQKRKLAKAYRTEIMKKSLLN